MMISRCTCQYNKRYLTWHTHTHTQRERHTYIWAKSHHCFHMELVYNVSRGQQTVIFVNTLRAYKRPNFSLKLENNLRRQTSLTCIDWVHIGRIYLVIRTQNKPEVSIWCVKMFYIQVSFGPQKFFVESKLWCESSYHMYALSRQWTTRTCCLLRAVVSNGMFLRASAFCT